MKEYNVPDELHEIMVKAVAYSDLRDRYINRPFGFKKAKECAELWMRYKLEFWFKLYKVYPELKGKRLSYVLENREVLDRGER